MPPAPVVVASVVTADKASQIVDVQGSQREKRIKALRKKLREIESIKAKSGLLKDAQVTEKLSRLASYQEELAELEAPEETAQALGLVTAEDLWEKHSAVAAHAASTEANVVAQAGHQALHKAQDGEACDLQRAPQTPETVLGNGVQQKTIVPEPFERAELHNASANVPESWMDLDDGELSEPVLVGASHIEEDTPESRSDLDARVASSFSFSAAQLETGSVQASKSRRHSRARKDFLNLCKAASKWQRQVSHDELIEKINASRVASDCRAKHGDAFDEKAFLEIVLSRCGSP
jgi:hypothetical protein